MSTPTFYDSFGGVPYGETPYAGSLDEPTPAVSQASEDQAYIDESVGVSISVSAATMYIGENVEANLIPEPVLWYINPDQANPGDTVFITGTGLGAFQSTYRGRIIFGSLTPLPLLWEYVGPSPNAFTDNRQIIPSQQICDTEHELLSFAVPQGAPSGYIKVSTAS